MQNRSNVIVAVLIAASFLYGGYVFIRGEGDSVVYEVEVRDYRGERLGSIGDFRENSISGPQLVDEASFRLTVDGLVTQAKQYTIDEVTTGFTPYLKVVTIDCVEGWSVKILWEGVRLGDILAASGVNPEGKVVIFHAMDGYTSSLTLDYIEANGILLAYRMNGLVIPPERGYPFQVVAESKWGYKWVKWVNWIEVSSDEGYEGFWESRGYSNYGGTDASMFGG